MTFTLDPQVAAVLEAAQEHNGPPPQPPVGDVEITEYKVTAADGAELPAR
jgi:hypothetical protein